MAGKPFAPILVGALPIVTLSSIGGGSESGTDAGAASSSPTASSSPAPGASAGTVGVADGVDAVVLPVGVTAAQVLGVSDRTESSYADAFESTYNPSLGIDYFTVTKDQPQTRSSVMARLASSPYSGAAHAAPTTDTHTVIVFSAYTKQQIDNSLQTLSTAIGGRGLQAAFSYDPATDTIQLQAPTSLDSILPRTPVPVATSPGKVESTDYRANMPSPYVGGGSIYHITSTTPTTIYYTRCTSGIPAYNANGVAGYFTAKHCFPILSQVYASTSFNSSSYTGKVSNSYGSDDAAFVSGATYAGKVYTSVDFSVKKPVVGTYFPATNVHQRLCFSGSTTGVNAAIT